VSLYAATKKANELLAYSYAHLYGLALTGLRFFTVYGPFGRPDMAYFSFTKAILNQETIQVFNHGKLARDFTYIDDIVEGMVRLMDRPASTKEGDVPHRVFNIGNHHPVALMTFIETLETVLGQKALKEYVSMQPGDVMQTFADVSALHEAVGFEPNTSLEDGLKKFVDWYATFYDVGERR
jgi:UDP-glucuronate 4-epimerase